MHVVNKQELPFAGSSFRFVGADHTGASVSIFFVEAQPGRGAPLHTHEYDEIILVQEGRSRLVIGGAIREAGPDDIVVVKAATPHGFVNCGAGVLKQIDIHASPRFAQTVLPSTETSRQAGLPEQIFRL